MVSMLPMPGITNGCQRKCVYLPVLQSNACPVLSRLVPHVSLGLFDYKEEQSSLAFNHVFNTNSQPDEMIP